MGKRKNQHVFPRNNSRAVKSEGSSKAGQIQTTQSGP